MTGNTPKGISIAPPDAHQVQWIMAFLTVAIPNAALIWGAVVVIQGRAGWIELALFATMYFVTLAGATIGMHRLFSHRAFQTSRWMTTLLAITGSMAAQGPLMFWASNHRRHHAYSDRVGDPHSPNLHGDGFRRRARGLWFSHIGWMFSDETSNWSVFIRDLVRNRLLFDLHRSYLLWVLLGLAIPTLAGGLLHRSWLGAWYGLLFGGLIRMALVNHAAWAVGSLSHRWGTTPFRTRDLSVNNYFVALVAFGEGLQNNHHAFPSSARHGLTWWQPDISGWIIIVLAKLGLIWNVKHPSASAIRRARGGADCSHIGVIEEEGALA